MLQHGVRIGAMAVCWCHFAISLSRCHLRTAFLPHQVAWEINSGPEKFICFKYDGEMRGLASLTSLCYHMWSHLLEQYNHIKEMLMCLHIDLNAGELKEMCTNKKKQVRVIQSVILYSGDTFYGQINNFIDNFTFSCGGFLHSKLPFCEIGLHVFYIGSKHFSPPLF